MKECKSFEDHEFEPNKNLYGLDLCKYCQKDMQLILMQDWLERNKEVLKQLQKLKNVKT